jgi:hypothetical protein
MGLNNLEYRDACTPRNNEERALLLEALYNWGIDVYHSTYTTRKYESKYPLIIYTDKCFNHGYPPYHISSSCCSDPEKNYNLMSVKDFLLKAGVPIGKFLHSKALKKFSF